MIRNLGKILTRKNTFSIASTQYNIVCRTEEFIIIYNDSALV